MRLKPLDFVIIAAAAGAVAFSAFIAYGRSSGELQVDIRGMGGEWIYPLSSDREVAVAGPLGDTIVEIRDKKVWIKDSPCPNKTCIAVGAVSQPDQWIACLPNQVFIKIEGGGKEEGVDAGVY